jgi:succinate dehydrogenase / fumarate reductase iron-sulfur subunit
MNHKLMKLKVLRYDPEGEAGIQGAERYDVFKIEPAPGMTVLDALFAVQNTLDDSLAFRYACRGAICGSCAMLINKVPRLACRTQAAKLLDGSDRVELKPYPAVEGVEDWDPSEEILVEPLPHLPVIKDLVVDMEKFFKFYRAVEPVLKPAGEVPEREFEMDASAVKELEKYTNCILCGACVGSCPVNSKAAEYLGPAALAKLYRFHIDTREAGDDSRLLLADNASGWWGCEFHTNCKRVCPKKVAPNIGIGSARRRLTEIGKAHPESGKGPKAGKDDTSGQGSGPGKGK